MRTKAQNKIDARVRLLFEHGSCDVWVKERNYYDGKLNRMFGSKAGMAYFVDEDKSSGAWANRGISEIEEVKEYRNNVACTASIDPILTKLMNRSERHYEHVWYDPIVVNKTAGWLMIMPESSLRLNHQSCDEPVQTSDGSSWPKNTRGRPKKTIKQQRSTHEPDQSTSKSSMEA